MAHEHLELRQIDVKTISLHGDLNADIYIEQPISFQCPSKSDHEYMLNKALYGLKQALRKWYAKINSLFKSELKIHTSLYDPCSYVRRDEQGILVIAVYVHDVFIAGSYLETVYIVKAILSK